MPRLCFCMLAGFLFNGIVCQRLKWGFPAKESMGL